MHDLTDRTISFTYTVAAFLWTAAAAIIVADWFVPVPLGAAGIFFSTIAACCTVRGFLVQMHCRELKAFELGRELGALQARDADRLHAV